MTLIDLWRERRPQSSAVRYALYAATVTIVILLGLLTARLLTTKAADDCNKPTAPVNIPKAPPGLIVDAPCTDGSVSPKAPSPGK